MRFAALMICAVLGIAADIDVTGNWSGKTKTSIDGKVEEDTIYLSLKQTSNQITGTAGPSVDQQAPINNGKIEGNHITFDLPVPGGAFKFDINLEGDHLKGDVVASAQGQTVKAVMDAARVK
jgi:hypothetical protein